LQGLSAVEKRLLAYGYSLKAGYTPFYTQSTALDKWDIMKSWKSAEN
jgi:hypothetical protein